MKQILCAWIGMTDLRAAAGEIQGLGPIGQAAAWKDFDQILLLHNQPAKEVRGYAGWLREKSNAKVTLSAATLSGGPTDYRDIYKEATRILEPYVSDSALTFHLSPGTPAMAIIWILLSSTRIRAALIESSKEVGVREVDFPFDLAAEILPEFFAKPDEELERLVAGLGAEHAEFSKLVGQCQAMKQAVARGRYLALREVPTLILGESGTGKSHLARAMHVAGPRRGPFIAVNCGAIPKDLAESELFGHAKGAFSGAHQARAGHLESANGGTLFLDEIGELSLDLQVKLLRAIEEKKIARIGESHERPLEIRIIAATNRDLLAEVDAGRFREDLFHRLAVGVIEMPPLRERKGDFGPLVEVLLAGVNEELKGQQGYQPKSLSAGARKLLQQQPWPGNVRELRNTLVRAALWSGGETIEKADIERNLLQRRGEQAKSVLDRPLGDGFSLDKTLDEVRRHYLARALSEAGGTKTRAAELLGYSNYQTLSHWTKKFAIGE